MQSSAKALRLTTAQPWSQTQRIAAAREILDPSPVRLHHVPNWLRMQIIAKSGRPPFTSAGWAVLQHAIRVTDADAAFDHWGSTKWGEHLALCSEPYLSLSGVDAAKRFAAHYCLRLDISPNSYWFPGATTRLVWFPCTEAS